MTFFKTVSIGPAPGIEPKRPPALQSNFFLPTELILTQFILVLCSQCPPVLQQCFLLLTPTKPLHLKFNWNTSSSLGFVVVVVIFLYAWINIEWNCWVSVNQESSGTLPAAAKNKRACHSLQIGNLVIEDWIFCFVWKSITGIAFSGMADVLDTFVWDKELQFISVIS